MTQRSSEYLQDSLLTTDPVELIRMLYQIALNSIDRAMEHLRDGDAMARSRAVSKAHEAVTELLTSLDHEKGGPLSRQLASLYLFVQEQLLAAHAKKSEQMLHDARRVLATLAEAWSSLEATQPATRAEEQPISVATVSAFAWQDPSQSHRSSGWTL